MAAAATTRPRLSAEFMAARKRERIVAGLARCVVKQHYRSVTVTDIVSEAGVARNTFYEVFSSKDAVATALLREVCPALDLSDVERDLAGDSALTMALEIAAPHRVGEERRGSDAATTAWHVIDEAAEFVAEPLDPSDTDDGVLVATLPPGRHGLGEEFVRRNQHRRLVEGTARALNETGYAAAMIADITRHAAVSRRTFYEHFDGKRRAVDAMVVDAEERGAPTLGPSHPSGFNTGVYSLWAEIVAAQLVGDRVGAEERRQGGEDVLRALDEVVA